MSIDSIQVYSSNLKADERIYEYLTGCRQCQINSQDKSVHFDNGSFWLLLEDGCFNPDRVGRFTGLNFITCDLEHDCDYLEKIGAIVNKTGKSKCENYLLAECKDISGNTVTLMQLNESDEISYL